MHRRIAIAAVATLGLSAPLATLPAVATGKKDVAPAAAPAPAPTPAPPAPTPAPARPQTSPAPAKTTPAPAPKDKKGKNDDGLAAPLTPAPDLASGPAAAPQDAVVGSAVVIGVAEGVVRVHAPGAAASSELGPGAAVPVGSVVDAREGTVRLTTEVPGRGTQGALLRGARFEVRQTKADGMTDLVLRGGDFGACRRSGTTTARAAVHRSAPRRSLWAKDSGGRFRTHGRNSVATVRGTEWVTTDTCAGTTTRVRSGAVLVRDLHTGRRVLVRAGRSHLVRARRG